MPTCDSVRKRRRPRKSVKSSPNRPFSLSGPNLHYTDIVRSDLAGKLHSVVNSLGDTLVETDPTTEERIVVAGSPKKLLPSRKKRRFSGNRRGKRVRLT